MINADIYAINLPVGTICVFLVMTIWRKHCLQTARKPLVLLDFFKSYNFTPTKVKAGENPPAINNTRILVHGCGLFPSVCV